MRGLLKDKKLERVVDEDLDGNYVDEEVEQMVQIALLCTQGTATERPKMSEVVRMLEGDGLSQRWEQWQKEEMLRKETSYANNPNPEWFIADSTYNLSVEQVSGPR